jgi:hypothetical protein
MLTPLLQGWRAHSKEVSVGTISRIGLLVGIAAAIAGCSAPLAAREQGTSAGGVLAGNPMQGGAQRPAPQPAPSEPMRVVFASPPPIVAQSPRYVWVPDWGVYVLEEYDIVYSDGYHYYLYEGHWYVARSCAGPWAPILSPPPTLAAVPPSHFHKRLPPGLARIDAVPPGQMH